MTNVKLPDEMVKDVVDMVGQPDPDAAVFEALSEFMQYRRQLRVLDFEGQFDADPTYDYKAQRRVP